MSPLFLVWMTSTASFKSGIGLLQILGHIVAVPGVVGHDEQDGLLAHLLVFGVGLAPFDHAEMDIVGVLLGVLGALALLQLRPARRIGQDGVLDDILEMASTSG